MAEMLVHLLSTLMRLSVSMLIAFAAALPPAVLLGRHRELSRLFDPLIELLYSVPKISLFPLIVVLVGLNDKARILTASLVVFFQVLITIRDAASVIPEEYILSIETLGAGRFDKIRWVYLPSLLPSIFTSLRIGTAAAFAVLFFTEASVTKGFGMGRLVIEKWSELDYKAMGGAALVTAFTGLLIFLLIDRLEKRFLKGCATGRDSFQ
ncbi:MAG: ABC transporter permease subunit [Spirochaetales bacterium]|nr:ABC transporter permease subunit [Spirochaetales bacterium]